MNLQLPQDSKPIKEMFERFFATESSPARVRAAEPLGFDPDLWRSLIDLEAPFLRLGADFGGADLSLFDACLMLEQSGRRLASAPLAESVAAMKLLGDSGGAVASAWIDEIRREKCVITLALQRTDEFPHQLAPGVAAASCIVTFDGAALAIERLRSPAKPVQTLGGIALGEFIAGQGERHILAEGERALSLWQAALEEWKILTSASLIGLSREALDMAAAYARDRIAFGQPIGAYQGIAHPLANDAMDADGAAMLLWWTLRAIADRKPDASACVSLLFWWANKTAGNCVAHALHTFGGYGLTNEYDIQLYHRRAKTLGLIYGDPEEELVRAGKRLYLAEHCSLPNPGRIEVNFDAPAGGEALARETRAVFAKALDPAKHRLGDHSFESHDWDVHRALGRASLLYPDWPQQWGGRDADPDAARASLAVWQEVGYTPPLRSVTGLAGNAVLQFGSRELQEEVLNLFASGEAGACLGYTEPSGGSDVFAAKTRAARDGDHWIINGQKMFTSGADLARYVLLITRTDPDAPKHKGITIFLAPLDTPGVEIHPVHTFMDERTNATFYSDVRIHDRYRLGAIHGGAEVLASALAQEQTGGYYHLKIKEMVDAAAGWATTTTRGGAPLINQERVLARLATAYGEALISEALSARVLGAHLAHESDLAFGPAAKVFGTEAFLRNSANLLDLAAPFSLARGSSGLGLIELGYRHSTATTIYGGTSEVLRSMVAERRLGLPRSRSK